MCQRPIRWGNAHWGLVVVLSALLTACVPWASSRTEAAGPTTTAVPSAPAVPSDQLVATTGCGQPSAVAPGTSATVVVRADAAISNGANTRTYRLHVPAVYDTSRPIPIVLVFHGYGGSAEAMDMTSGFTPLAEQQHFLAVYPQGLLMGGAPFWASAGPVDEGIDEIPFITSVLDDVQKHYCVDAKRIYATGFSNGGGMTGFLACRLARRIAAFAPASGNYYALPGGCHPGRPVPIAFFHGTADPIVAYDGVPSAESPDFRLPSIPETLHDWVVRDGCTHSPNVLLQEPGMTGEEWTGCRGNAVVILFRAEGGGHSLPGAIGGQPVTEVIWHFFATHPLS